MKKIIISLLAAAGIAIPTISPGCSKIKDPYPEGLRQEQAGNYPLALSHYVSSLEGMADSRPLPSKAEGMAYAPEKWMKELNAYVDWLSAPAERPKRFPAVIDAISRVGEHVENQHYVTESPRDTTTMAGYTKAWNSIFYPAGKPPPPGQRTIIEKAMNASISILTIVGNTSYEYKGKVINRTTGKSVDFVVFNEGQFSLLAPPGNYYFMVTGKAKFQLGQVWVSPLNVLPISIPDSTSLLTVRLNTEVKRRT